MPQYEELAEKAQKLWTEFADRQKTVTVGDKQEVMVTFNIDDDFSIICEALGLGYRVGKYEVALLGLLTPTSTIEALKAMIDFPTILKLLEEDKATGGPENGQAETPAAAPAPTDAPATQQEG